MKKLSEIYKKLGIAFTFPIEINDSNGRKTYYEASDDYWERYEYDANGNPTYSEDSNDVWERWERDADGNMTYYEDSDGVQEGTPRSAKTCEGKVIEVDGIKYELKADLTMDTSRETQRFQAYYIDYLLNYDSIGSYAASHGLTYETAKYRIETGERVHLSQT